MDSALVIADSVVSCSQEERFEHFISLLPAKLVEERSTPNTHQRPLRKRHETGEYEGVCSYSCLFWYTLPIILW